MFVLVRFYINKPNEPELAETVFHLLIYAPSFRLTIGTRPFMVPVEMESAHMLAILVLQDNHYSTLQFFKIVTIIR